MIFSKSKARDHWFYQRISAIAMIVLLGWMAVLVISLAGADYLAAVQIVGQPVNKVLIALFMIIGLWHGALGLQVIAEDYVSDLKNRHRLIAISRLAGILIGIIALISLIKIGG